MNHPNANGFLDKIIKLAEKDREVEVLWLYGSRADGTAHEKSDYDLAIAYKTFIKDPLEDALRPELLRIDWSKELGCNLELISIVDINRVPIPLAWEVVTKGKPLLVKNFPRLMQEERRIFSSYELDVLYHRKQYGK